MRPAARAKKVPVNMAEGGECRRLIVIGEVEGGPVEGKHSRGADIAVHLHGLLGSHVDVRPRSAWQTILGYP
jgi:hypothetical protein